MSNLEQIKPEEYGIEQAKATELYGNLPQLKEERSVLEQQFNEVIKMDIESPDTWREARELRLLIQKNRTKGINIWHKTNKDVFLRGGQFVDAIKRAEVAVNERMESALEEIEKHEQIQEQKRLAELQKERELEILPYLENAEEIDLASMDCDVWEAYFQAKKKAYEDEQARIKAELEAEKERERLRVLRATRENELKLYWQFVPEQHPDFETLSNDEWSDFLEEMVLSKEKHDKEQEEIRKENERLQKEAEEKEKARQAELKAIRDREEKERKEREAKAEAERKRIAEQEAKLKAEKEEAERKLREAKEAEEKRLAQIEADKQAELNKGDAAKVQDLKNDLEALKTKYSFKSAKNKKMYENVGILLNKIINHIN